MPCMELTMPKADPRVKRLLSEKMTNAFSEATGHSRDIFGIYFREYGSEETSNGGKLWDGKTGIPYLHIALFCPRLRRSVKRIVVSLLVAAFVECIEKPDWKPVIHITEHPYDNVGVDGKLLSDLFEECAKREFYYKLPND